MTLPARAGDGIRTPDVQLGNLTDSSGSLSRRFGPSWPMARGCGSVAVCLLIGHCHRFAPQEPPQTGNKRVTGRTTSVPADSTHTTSRAHDFDKVDPLAVF